MPNYSDSATRLPSTNFQKISAGPVVLRPHVTVGLPFTKLSMPHPLELYQDGLGFF